MQTVGDALGGDSIGAAETTVGLNARTRTASVFAADSVALGRDWHLTAAGRYDRTTVTNRDELRSAPDPASLDGDHVFARLNPAVGVNWNPRRAFKFYAGYSEGSRTPTAIELGCANPAQPCKLPNAIVGDPPLRQVVAHTIEAGVRGEPTPLANWRAGVFRADNRDDILFVSSEPPAMATSATSARPAARGSSSARPGARRRLARRGVDPARRALPQRRAVNGTANSSNDAGPGLDGTIDIVPGDRLPLVPRQIFKAVLDVAVDQRTSVAIDLVATSGANARGNENGGHVPDGVFYLGPGRSPGYAVVNLAATVQASRGLSFFGRIANVLDRRYATAAQLGATGFDASGRYVGQPFPPDAQGRVPLRGSTFFAPGAPRLFSAGLRYAFD